MSGENDTISRRRELLEEVLEERSKVVAQLPILEEDPPADSWAWPAGITRLAIRPPRALLKRRRVAVAVCVVGLAWLERIDAELDLPAQGSSGGEHDLSGPPAGV